MNQIGRQRDHQMPICPSARSSYSSGKKFCTKLIIYLFQKQTLQLTYHVAYRSKKLTANALKKMQTLIKMISGHISQEILHFSVQYISPSVPPVVCILGTLMLMITLGSYKRFPLIDKEHKWLKGNKTLMQEM